MMNKFSLNMLKILPTIIVLNTICHQLKYFFALEQFNLHSFKILSTLMLFFISHSMKL